MMTTKITQSEPTGIKPTDWWDDKIEVHCDWSTLKEIQNGKFEFNNWVVEVAEFNTDTQCGDIILRVMTYDDI